MQIKLHLQKTGPFLGWRIASIVLVGAMAASIILTGYFMYQNIYRSLDDANTIIVLNAMDGFDSIDLTTFNKAKTQVQLKRDIPPLTARIRNIFDFSSSTSPHAIIHPFATTTIASTTPATTTP